MGVHEDMGLDGGIMFAEAGSNELEIFLSFLLVGIEDFGVGNLLFFSINFNIECVG